MNRKIIGTLLLFTAAASWGGTYVTAKFILASIPAFSLMLGRYVVAFVVLCILCRVRGEKRLTRREIRQTIPPALIGYFLSMVLQFWSTELCGASVASLINVSTALFVAVFAAVLLRERITLRVVAACVVGFLGVALVTLFGSSSSASIAGSMLMILCAAAWALMTVMMKKLSTSCSTMALTTCGIGVAMVICVPFSMAEMVQAKRFFFSDPTVLLCVLYLGVAATAYAYFAWNKGMTMMDAGVASLFIYFQPLVAAWLGWLLLGEQLGWSFFVGGALLVAAIFISMGDSRPAA